MAFYSYLLSEGNHISVCAVKSTKRAEVIIAVTCQESDIKISVLPPHHGCKAADMNMERRIYVTVILSVDLSFTHADGIADASVG